MLHSSGGGYAQYGEPSYPSEMYGADGGNQHAAGPSGYNDQYFGGQPQYGDPEHSSRRSSWDRDNNGPLPNPRAAAAGGETQRKGDSKRKEKKMIMSARAIW